MRALVGFLRLNQLHLHLFDLFSFGPQVVHYRLDLLLRVPILIHYFEGVALSVLYALQ